MALAAFPAFAQMKWHYVDAGASGRTEDISVWDFSNVLVCGRDLIKRSTDGGQTWDTAHHEPNAYFRSIEFLDGQTAFAGTLDSMIFRSQDSGKTWQNITSKFTPVPYGICGMDAVDGVIHMVGNFFSEAYHFHSADGGNTFITNDLSSIANGLVDVYFVHADTGFACGSVVTDSIKRSANILKTVDGGKTWQQVALEPDTGFSRYSWKIFPNGNELLVSVETFDTISYFRSSDRGKNWDFHFVNTSSHNLQGIASFKDSLLWLGTHQFDSPPRFLEYDLIKDSIYPVLPNSVFTAINRFHRVSDQFYWGVGDGVWAYYDSTQTSLGSHAFQPMDESFKPKISIAPNPVTEGKLHFEIRYPDYTRSRVALLDVNGKLIKIFHNGYQKKGDFQYGLDVSQLPSGTYILWQYSMEGMQQKKVIIQN